MTDRSSEKTLGRRAFFIASGGAAAVGGAVLASTQAVAAVDPKTETRTDGYKATEHVKKYYELARF